MLPPFSRITRGLAPALVLTFLHAAVMATPPLKAEAAGKAQGSGGAADELFTEFTPETFSKFNQAQNRITLDQPDIDLLSAAILHETNRRRAAEKLPPLRHQAQVRQAARMQAEIMAETKTLTHVNTGPADRRTPADRLNLAGVKPAFMAENVALAFGIEYQPGEAVYTREEKGKKTFSRKSGGEPLAAHTALTFSAALLDTWMKSPAHRKNILSKEPVWLGTDLRPSVNGAGMPVFYCVQVFCAPLPGQ